MKKIRDLNWFDLWQDESAEIGFHVHSPTARVGSFRTLRRALEFIAAQPDPKRGDRGPIRHARHIAKCMLAEMGEAV